MPENDSRLFYVMGPSGAGKDTLIEGVRHRIGAGADILFAHRYITRPAEAGGENHVALTHDEFAARARAGLFSLDWESHGNRYGIGSEIGAWLDAGFSVVVNGSRGYLETAAARFPCIVPVLVTAPQEVIAARLAARNRENMDAIERRLARTGDLAPVGHAALRLVENAGSVEAGVDALLSVLTDEIRRSA